MPTKAQASLEAACPVCGNPRAQARETFSHMLNLQGHVDSRVVGCAACGTLYMWPRMADNVITDLYSKSYFTGVTADGKENAAPAADYDFEVDCSRPRLQKFNDVLDILLSYRPHAKSILDIGAATGDFLAIAQKKGLSVTGIELSDYAATQAREKYGFEFHQVQLADYRGSEKYDFIHLNHVFEHFVAPNQALDRIEALLARGGMVYIEVPFQFSIIETAMHRLTGRRKPFDVFSVHHPVFYRPETLKRIFHEHGFDCRALKVFQWSRYPAAGIKGHVKKLIWLAAGVFGQGLFIEAFFERR